MEDIRVAYIGGGSKGWAWAFMMDLALNDALSGEMLLYDINYDSALSNEKIGNRLFNRKDVKSQWKFRAVRTLKETLSGADFVIISILPGTFKEMYSDVHEPEKYGIYQSVGDTVGPGGIIRALRTLPAYIEIAQAVKEYSNKAWVINYTNPMSLCTRILYEVFPDIKAFGCCHEIFHTQGLLVDMLREIDGYKSSRMPIDDIKINVLGINHFTWITHASYNETDLFPLYRDFVEKYYKDGYEARENTGIDRGDWTKTVFSSAQRVKFDLFKRFGVIAAAGDRHLAEFVPQNYLSNPDTVKNWKFHLTPVSWRIEDKKRKEEMALSLLSEIEKMELKQTGEKGIDIIKALLGLGDLVTNVNLPNRGQMEGVPDGSIVETNAFFRRDLIQPLISGRLPDELNKIVKIHIDNQETVIKAVIEKNIDLAFKSFMNDPAVKLDNKKGRDLFNSMIGNTKEYLSYFF